MSKKIEIDTEFGVRAAHMMARAMDLSAQWGE